MKGWIKLHREIKDHWIWDEKPFDKRSAWIDILLMANHKDNKFLLGNELVEIEKGSFITSELKLMEKWGWSKTKVRSFLTLLQKDKMIVKNSDKKKTALTVVNYSVYQETETTEKPQEDHKKTTEEPQEDTNKNVKECTKNENNVKEDIIYTSELEIFDYWNSKKGVVCSKENSFDKNKITTVVKHIKKDEILKAIDRLDKAVLDPSYYYNFKWNIYKFFKQVNGISNWLDDGQIFNDYVSKGGGNGQPREDNAKGKGESESGVDWSKYEQSTDKIEGYDHSKQEQLDF